ncbi:MAG: DNA helicase RecQ [Rhizobiales bacterium]|nr:DNA helicase RecQ [Hyphomicrobiales bacterium]
MVSVARNYPQRSDAPGGITVKHEVLRATFGYEHFRPGQEAIVDSLLAGRNVLAVMPTGSGKSLCYQVPALVKGGLAIVVSPLVALMQDQVAALKLAGVTAETINSSASRENNIAIWRRVAEGAVRILYLAPERLMTDRMIAALQKLDVTLIAIDEAHCISQWGASFRPEYDTLRNLRTAFPGVPIGAFTATADEATRRDIINKLFCAAPDVFVAGFDRPNIKLTVQAKSNTRKQLLEFLEDHPGESGIVYTLSRNSVEKLAAFLAGKSYRAVPYHAGLSAAQRAESQNLFMSEKGVIVCATIAFGMGIDKSDVRFVFHADLPGTLDAYYQEIGRAGRDGEPAEAHMVFGLQDIAMRRHFVDEEEGGDERRRREHKRLDALVAYCEAPSCRRQSLLAYFGEASSGCGNCDVCLDPAETVDGTGEARKIFETMRLTGERFGAVHIVDVLEGKANDKTIGLKHVDLPVFGLGKDRKRVEWQSLVRQLVGGGFLTLDVAGHGGLSIGDKGRALLRGEEEFHYRRDMIREGKRRRLPPSVPPSSDPRQDALLQRLKALRLQLARQRQVPAYVIFPDRTLIDMAARLPLNRRDFGEVHGVGAAKLEQFGDIFLNEIRSASAN